MTSLLNGQAVTVIRTAVEYDELHEPTYGAVEREDVEDVLVAPGATADLDASRPNGVEVAYTLYLPKTYTGSLRGCSVEIGETAYEVVGDPLPYPDELVPGTRNRVVEVRSVDG